MSIRLPRAFNGNYVPNIDTYPELATLYANHARLKREAQAENIKLDGLIRGKGAAQQADTQALATSLADGTKLTGPSAVETNAKETEESKKRYAAYEMAVRDSASKVTEYVQANRDMLVEDASKRAEEARVAFLASLDAMATAYQHAIDEHALEKWLRGFPDVAYAPLAGVVPSLVGLNGDAFTFDAVVAALRKDASPKPPKPIAEPTQGESSGEKSFAGALVLTAAGADDD